MRPHCSFATLSEGRIHWHQPNDPVAAYPSIVSCHEFILEPNPLEPPETWSRVQVFGDLVVWTAGEDYEDGSGLTEVIVRNWKTGRNVWVSTEVLSTCVSTAILIDVMRVTTHA